MVQRRQDAACAPFHYGLLLVLFTSPLIFSTAFYEFENLPRSLLIQAGALLVPACWLVWHARGHAGAISGGPAGTPLLLLATWGLVSISWSTYRYGALSQWIHWAACGVFYVIAFNVHRRRRDVLRTLYALMATAAVIATLGILQHLAGLQWVPQQVAPAATFNNKNMAAQFMVLTFPISLGLAATAADRRLVWLFALVTALDALFLYYTRTRAAWLAVLAQAAMVGGGIWIYRSRASIRRLFDGNRTAALVVSLLLLAGGMQLGPGSLDKTRGAAPETAEREMGDSFDISSARHRSVLWRNTLAVIAEHPIIGVGIRNVQVHYPTAPDKSHHRLALHTQRVHNDYLQIYAELGLPALLVFVWVTVLVGKRTAVLIRSDADADWFPPVTICAAALSGLAVNAIFSFPLNRALPPFLSAVYLGLFFKTVALATENPQPTTVASGLGRRACIGLSVSWCVLVVAWGVTAYHWSMADHYYRKHLLAFLAGDAAAAIAHGKTALEYNPARGAILRSLSRAYVRHGDYAAAEALFERIDKVFSHAPLHLYYKSVALINRKRYEEAAKTIREGLAVIPRSGKLHGLLGVVRQARGQTDEAIRAFRRAIALSPGVERHHQWLARLLFTQERFDEAIPVLSDWTQIAPDNPEAFTKLGVIFLSRGELGPAEENFRHAVRLEPGDADPHRYLGVVLFGKGDLEPAARQFHEALRYSRGKDAVAHNNLGSIRARQGRLDRAVEHYRAALELEPRYAEARANLEKALELLGADR